MSVRNEDEKSYHFCLVKLSLVQLLGSPKYPELFICSSSNSKPRCFGAKRSRDWFRMRKPSRSLTKVCCVSGLPLKSEICPPKSSVLCTSYSPHITGGST